MCTVRGHGPERGIRRGAIDGGKIWWVAPTYPISQEIWRDLKRATREAWIDKSEQERRIELPGGGSVSVKSADDPTALVGVGLDGVVMDEAGKTRREAWYESLRATLSDTGGWSIFIGTPKGHNWFYDLFRQAEATPEWERWQRPTSDNPLVSKEELEKAYLDIGPRLFNQEYLARFTDVEGAEWPAECFGPEIWFDEWPADLTIKTIFIDPSKGKDAKSGDYSAIVMLGRDADGTLWCEADLARRTTDKIVEDGLEWYRRFQPDGLGVEANQFQELLVNDFRRISQQRGIMANIFPVVNTVNKQVRIRRLTSYLMAKQIRFKAGKGTQLLVDQLRDFPEGEHDDGPDALEGALRLAVQLWNGRMRSGQGQPMTISA